MDTSAGSLGHFSSRKAALLLHQNFPRSLANNFDHCSTKKKNAMKILSSLAALWLVEALADGVDQQPGGVWFLEVVEFALAADWTILKG
jgi:hypothetical protein